MRSNTVACLAVAVAVILLPGCARSIEGTPVAGYGQAGQKSPSTQSAKNYDISRLSKLESEFPAGFHQIQSTPVMTLGPVADKFSSLGVGQVIAVNPPQCQSLLQPVRPPREAKFTMVGAVGKGAIMVSAVKSPVPLAQDFATAGCAHAAVIRQVSRKRFDSTVTRLPGPAINGVTTTGSMDVAAVGGSRSYVFAGFLGDTVAVAVQGLLPGNSRADEVLQDMLVKAVNAIRAD